MSNDEVKELQAAFKLVCKKCGSENVVIDAVQGSMGSEYTGYMVGTLSIGCNACKQNDLHLDN